MKLSEAIRLGSMLSTQGFASDSLVGEERCALGAAAQAIGISCRINGNISHKPIVRAFPWLLTTSGPCPACGKHITGAERIWHLNDQHRYTFDPWPRERIANWVATIEPEEPPSVVMEETLEALKNAEIF